MKKLTSRLLVACLIFSALPISACSGVYEDDVLRIASWDEYIDMGGEDSYYDENSRPIYEEFVDWYYEQTGKKIKVEYVALQDNETMYNKIKMGDRYDLLCPSEYMAMKLKSENRLLAYPDEFFDASIPTNYYAQNVSHYTNEVFGEAQLTGYIAGYMWGTTGFVFNPETIADTPEKSREIMSSWSCLTAKECNRKITAKDNVRDSYFMGLGLYYEQTLLEEKARLQSAKDKYNNGETSEADYLATLRDYKNTLNGMMNDTLDATTKKVKPLLKSMRGNVYGLETDEGKMDVATGLVDACYQWSGDAVYILDVGEEEDLELEYSIPSSASNLWFDGWVMMKDTKNADAAMAFVNYISRPDNVVRNMYYIGYTSCLGGQEVYDYVVDTYGAEDGEENVVSYDLSYFFGDTYEPFLAPESQTRRQLFAQYPDKTTTERLVVMKYFDQQTNERINRMWINIK